MINDNKKETTTFSGVLLKSGTFNANGICYTPEALESLAKQLAEKNNIKFQHYDSADPKPFEFEKTKMGLRISGKAEIEEQADGIRLVRKIVSINSIDLVSLNREGEEDS